MTVSRSRLLLACLALSASGGAVVLLAPPAGAQDGGRPLSAQMSGAQEVTSSGASGVGDPDGSGTALVTVNSGTGRVCFELDVTGIAPATRAHIHRGVAGRNGAIVVPFFEGSDSSATSGCVSVSRSLATELRQAPETFYFNVHNAQYPAGAIRGQLSK